MKKIMQILIFLTLFCLLTLPAAAEAPPDGNISASAPGTVDDAVSVAEQDYNSMSLMSSSIGEWAGSGTESDPYQIASAEELALLAERVNAGNSYAGIHFLVTGDLDLSGYTNWEPIGNRGDGKAFQGIFDGSDRNISGLAINEGSDNAGLFGYVSDGAAVRSVHLTNVSINTTGSVSSGIIGYVYVEKSNCVVIENGSVSGNISSRPSIEGWAVGGVIGSVHAEDSGFVIIKNCTSSGKISFTTSRSTQYGHVGGVIGYLGAPSGSIIVEVCHSDGSVSSSDESTYGDNGGLVGCVYAANSGSIVIVDCYSSDSVFATWSSVGGIAGRVWAEESCSITIENCYSSGSVSSSQNSVGGIIGHVYAYSHNVSLQSCVALNPVVTGSSNVGRIVGYISDPDIVTVTGCYALTTMDAGGATDGLDVTPATAATQSFYEDTLGWDFSNIWMMNKHLSSYPVLRGTSSSPDLPPEDPESPDLRLRVLSADSETLYSVDGKEVSVNSPIMFLVDADIDASVYPAPHAEIIITTPSGGKTTEFGWRSFSDLSLNSRTNAYDCAGFLGKDQLELGTYTATAAFTSPASYTARSNEVTFTLVPPPSPSFTLAGTGTESDPYLIRSAADLVQLGDAVSAGITFEDTYFLLTRDIDLSGYENWEPIGDFLYYLEFWDEDSWNTDAYQQSIHGSLRLPFCGIFDGDGHTITGLTTSRPQFTGLFGYLNAGAVLKNIRLTDVNVSGTQFVGSLVGGIYADYGPVRVENCSVESVGSAVRMESVPPRSCGGLIGRAYTSSGSVVIQDSVGRITESQLNGGLIGTVDAYSGNLTITRCSAVLSNVSAFGGLTQDLFVTNGTLIVQDCYCEGSGEMTGGLTSSARSSSDGSLLIENCYTAINGTSVPYSSVGGLIASASVDNYYNSWNPFITDSSSTWGKLTIQNCVVLNSVVAGGNAGRIIGSVDKNVSLFNLYALSSMFVSGSQTGYDGLDVTFADAATQSFYEDTLVWDFVNVWKMDNKLSRYPVFMWQQEKQEIPYIVIRDTVADGEWDAGTAAEMEYRVSPAGLSSLPVPVLSHGNRSLVLTNVTVLRYVNGVASPVPASVSAVGRVVVADDISDADYVLVTFFGNCLGDATGDGRVTSGDAAYVAQYAAKLRQLNETQLFYADATGDGKVTSGDAAYIAQYAAKLRDTHYHLFEV